MILLLSKDSKSICAQWTMVKGFILAKAELLDHDTILLESSDKCINVIIWWDSVSPTHPPPFDQMPGYLRYGFSHLG